MAEVLRRTAPIQARWRRAVSRVRSGEYKPLSRWRAGTTSSKQGVVHPSMFQEAMLQEVQVIQPANVHRRRKLSATRAGPVCSDEAQALDKLQVLKETRDCIARA